MIGLDVFTRPRRSTPTRAQVTMRTHVRLILFAALFAPIAEMAGQLPMLNIPARKQAPRTRVRLAVDTVMAQGRVFVDKSMMESGRFYARLDTVSNVAEDDKGDLGIWTGATVAYNFASSGDAAEKLSVSGQVALNRWAPDWFAEKGVTFRVPIIGNVAKPTSGKDKTEQLKAKADELLASSSGIYAGIQPFLAWRHKRGYSTRLFTSATVRTNTLKDVATDSSFSMTHGRFSIGGSATIGDFQTGEGAASMELSYSRFKDRDYARGYGVDRKRLVVTDLVVILPIAEKVGLLGQLLFNHTENQRVWRAGVALRPGE